MKLRVADRILVACAGLLLLAACAGLVAQIFFQVDLIGFAEKVLSSESVKARWILIGMAVLLFLLGVYCVLVLFRHRRRKDKFVLQKNENGELAISLKALENMVQKCVDQHEEIHMQHMYLENQKGGLLIRIRGSVAGGISIPLTVENMQKQIRQYVTACSGVDIKGVRVQIDESGKDAENAPFAIAAPTGKPLLKDMEEKPMRQEPIEAYVSTSINPDTGDKEPNPEAVPAAVPAAEPETAPPPVSADSYEDDDDRPLHQRLFSQPSEPCLYPEPPTEAELAEDAAGFTDGADPVLVADIPETEAVPTQYPVVSDPEGYADVDTEDPSALWADEYGIDADGAESPEPVTGSELIAEDSEKAAEPEGAKNNEEQNSPQSPVTGYEDSVMIKNREEGAME